MLTAWLADDHVVVVAIGPHDQSALDISDLLLDALDIDLPDDERTKPPCCDDEGIPPADHDTAESIADAGDNLARRRRRR